MTNPFSLENEVALVTGGATGIGFGIARCFVEAGARVVLCSRDEEALTSAVGELGYHASRRVHDVTETDGAVDLVAGIEREIGPVSILVNNAGVHLKKPAEEVTPPEFQKLLDVHVLGAHALTTAVGRGMLERGRGSVLFIASMASLFGFPGVVAYSAAKSAHLGMVRTLATEWGPRGVRVNAIAPGWIHSEMMHQAVDADPARKAKILGRTPLGGFGDPEDVGRAATYLCSPAAKFITGVCLPVDGGAAIGF
ncbi:SDR family NAD(P)-dependent oxidoreductase [Haloferula sp. A504]|uniref:SDR family NAD(P)-dependent oxidoreductase n=1 Tax=Haloferula sp. A504 TaxID=3373601 RepID=UPI0031C70AFF|nr:glucose 1-dehydrogenase [Verrucomicrobiaceae bacterium E54]